MGINTPIDLPTLNTLFEGYGFTQLLPTTNGVVDTTYIVSNKAQSYILKHFDREISQKIKNDQKLLERLRNSSLNVPTYLDHKGGWYLFDKLEGLSPKNIQLFHIRSLARFMAKYHASTYKQACKNGFTQNYPLERMLRFTKNNFYLHYKKLESLKNYTPSFDGFIHGDIFRDNTVFAGEKIGVFDFIDGGCGEFAFDIAVALISFNPKNKPLFTNAFLRTYNQNAPKKLTLQELKQKLLVARQFYALLRIDRYKGTAQARELISSFYIF